MHEPHASPAPDDQPPTQPAAQPFAESPAQPFSAPPAQPLGQPAEEPPAPSFYEQPTSFAQGLPAYGEAPLPIFGAGVALNQPVTVAWVARDVWAMLRNPRSALARPAQPWMVWTRVVGLYIIGMIFAGIAASLGAQASGATNILDEMRKNTSTLQGRLVLLALAGILAPLWEETAFRLPLAPFHVARVLPSMALLSVLMLPGKSLATRWILGAPMAAVALICVLALISKPWNAGVALWWEKNFRWVLVTSTLAFGFAHAGNYEFSTGRPGSLLVIPLLVMPQLIAGVLLAYTRLKLGFWFGVMLHSSVNTLLMLAVLAAPVEKKAKPKPASKPKSSLRATPVAPTRSNGSVSL